MKYFLSLLAGMIAIGTAAGAEFSAVDGPTYHATAPVSRAPVVITQNWDTVTIEAVQVACGIAGISTTQNWFLRRFYMSDYGIVNPLLVSGVALGVEKLAMADGSPPPAYGVHLRLYAINPPEAFLFANLTPLGAGILVPIFQHEQGTIIYVPVAYYVLPMNKDLVVAIDAPDGSLIGAGLQFLPGANSLGADHDAYLAAASCDVVEPVGVSDIGFPESQTIFVVYSDCCPPPPVPTEIRGWGRIKALYHVAAR